MEDLNKTPESQQNGGISKEVLDKCHGRVIAAKIIIAVLLIIIGLVGLCWIRGTGNQTLYDMAFGIVFACIGFFILVLKIHSNAICTDDTELGHIKHLWTYILYYPVVITFTGLAGYLIGIGILNDQDIFIQRTGIAVISFFLGLRIDGLYKLVTREK